MCCLNRTESEQASVLLKANFERTLAVVGHNTEGLLRLPFRIKPTSMMYLEQLRKLDQDIWRMAFTGDVTGDVETNRTLIRYIQSLEPVMEDPSPETLLACLLAQKSSHQCSGESDQESDEGYYSTGEVAQRLGISNVSVRRLCESGRFPGAIQTRGRHWRIPTSHFRTTAKQDLRAEKLLKRLDQKGKEAADINEFDLI